MDDVVSGLPDGTLIVEGTIFAEQLIACVSIPGGQAYVDAFFTKRIVELDVFAAKLRALQHKQDAFTILSQSLVNKMSHLQLT